MGNCLLVYRYSQVSCFRSAETSKKIVQLVKSDGKIIEFSTPILVRDVLQNFSGYNIASAKEAPLHLPLNFRLKLGGRYYLMPCTNNSESAKESPKFEKEDGGSVKRIKVVITRQQLQDLLLKQVLTADVLSESRKSYEDDNCLTIWKPELESIPEELETSCYIS